ncbi:MAG: Ig-like domain-containing protein [Armatimonadota bacterium]
MLKILNRKLFIIYIIVLLLFLFFSFSAVMADGVITSTTPGSGATGVALNQVIRVTFDKPCDIASVPANPLTNTNSGGAVPGAVSFADANRTMVFTSSSGLSINTNYTMCVAGTTFTGGAENLAGATSFTFTTINTPASVNVSVVPDSTHIGIDQPIVATYIFTEHTGVNINITNSSASFLNSSMNIIGTANIPVNFSIPGGRQSRYSDHVYIPNNAKNSLRDGRLTYRRYFYGTDAGGNSITVSGDVNITVTSSLGAKFTVTQITIDVPTNNSLYNHHEFFSGRAFIEGTGSGIVEGYWYMDDIPLDYFYSHMTNGVTLQVFTQNKLFTSNYGTHKLWIRTVSPNPLDSNKLYYSVTDGVPGAVVLSTPAKGKTFEKGDTVPAFTWSAASNSLGYKIAIVTDKKDFDKAEWIEVKNNRWVPSVDFWQKLSPGTYYWAVKNIGLDNKAGERSKAFYFKIKEKAKRK